MIQETFPMTVGGEEVLSERELLAGVENGLMMDSADSVRYIILHCSATRCNCDYTVEQLLRDHRARGFRTIGYHFYVRRDGTVSRHRRLLEVGAHCRPFNRCSIGVCYEGGLDECGRPADTRTYAQKCSLLDLLRQLKTDYPQASILGHYQLSNSIHKACPCFDAKGQYRGL